MTGHPRRLVRAEFETIAARNRRAVQELWGFRTETPYLHILWVHMGLMCEVILSNFRMYLLLADVSILGPHLPAVCGEVESHARAGTQQSFELGYANYALLSLPTLKSLCVHAIPRIIISLVGKLIRKILLSVYPPSPSSSSSFLPNVDQRLTFRKKRSASLDNTAVPLGKQ